MDRTSTPSGFETWRNKRRKVVIRCCFLALAFAAPAISRIEARPLEAILPARPAVEIVPQNSLGTLSFTAGVGQNPAPQTSPLNFPGYITSWRAYASGNWLAVNPTSGSSSGQLTLSVNTAGLAPGTYSGAVNITTPTLMGQWANYGTFTVALTVNPPTAPPSAPFVATQPAAACPAATGTSYVNISMSDHNFTADEQKNPGMYVGADFTGATLTGARFDGVNLTGAVFLNANLGPDSNNLGVSFVTNGTQNATLSHACFEGATLNGANFSYAQFVCTDLSNTMLSQANFGPTQNIAADPNNPSCRTSFAWSTIDVHVIPTSNWGLVNFSYTQFLNLNANQFSLNGVNITGALLEGDNFTGIDMTNATLVQVDFSYANLQNALLDSAWLGGVNLTHATLTSASLTCAQFYGTTPTNCKMVAPVPPNNNIAAILTQARLTYISAANATFDSSTLTGANLSGCTCTAASFQNAVFQSSGVIGSATALSGDFTGALFAGAQLNGATFNNVILTGAQFTGGLTLQGTDFTGSIMPNVKFSSAVLWDVKFPNTILQNAHFDGATLATAPTGSGSGVNFGCSQMGGADLSSATVTTASFLNAVLPPGPTGTPQCMSCSGATVCGNVNITGSTYAPAQLPVLNTNVMCPNGDNAECSPTEWAILNWQTDQCPTMGTIMWAPPAICPGTPGGQNVTFTDPNLQSCIAATLPGNPGVVPLTAAVQIEDVTCPNLGIQSTGGIEQFTNLKSLDLSANQIPSFGLTQANPLNYLVSLKIGYNKLQSLDLTYATGVQYLEASNNQLQSVSGLALVTNLLSIDLSGNQLTTVDLPILTNLTYADLSSNLLNNVLDNVNKDLSGLTSLAYLDLSYNSVPNIGSAAAIGNNHPGNPASLQTLLLACNTGFTCSSLMLSTQKGVSPALATSQCATFQNGAWVYNTAGPICPGSSSTVKRTPIPPLYQHKKK